MIVPILAFIFSSSARASAASTAAMAMPCATSALCASRATASRSRALACEVDQMQGIFVRRLPFELGGFRLRQ